MFPKERLMSIKKSLRTYILLLAAIPVIVMAALAYILASNKYSELTKNSIKAAASTYRDGFMATLDTMISNNEILAANIYVQSFLAEKINIPNFDLTTSNYYKTVIDEFEQQMGSDTQAVTYSLYDVDGYYVLGSAANTGDWSEYMAADLKSMTETVIYADATINDRGDAIDIVTPVLLKNNVIGIVRANVSIDYFGAFASEEGGCYIIDENGNFLFHHDTLSKDGYVMDRLDALRK